MSSISVFSAVAGVPARTSLGEVRLSAKSSLWRAFRRESSSPNTNKQSLEESPFRNCQISHIDEQRETVDQTATIMAVAAVKCASLGE